jgi:hypothetical protein
MKALVIQLRVLIAEWLLSLALDVVPKTPEGLDMIIKIREYFEEQVKKHTS